MGRAVPLFLFLQDGDVVVLLKLHVFALNRHVIMVNVLPISTLYAVCEFYGCALACCRLLRALTLQMAMPGQCSLWASLSPA